jgi:hypothetical protein
MEKQTQQYLDEIAVLKAENNQLSQKIKMLETKLYSAEKRCACFRNNQKLCEDTNENR